MLQRRLPRVHRVHDADAAAGRDGQLVVLTRELHRQVARSRVEDRGRRGAFVGARLARGTRRDEWTEAPLTLTYGGLA